MRNRNGLVIVQLSVHDILPVLCTRRDALSVLQIKNIQWMVAKKEEQSRACFQHQRDNSFSSAFAKAVSRLRVLPFSTSPFSPWTEGDCFWHPARNNKYKPTICNRWRKKDRSPAITARTYIRNTIYKSHYIYS